MTRRSASKAASPSSQPSSAAESAKAPAKIGQKRKRDVRTPATGSNSVEIGKRRTLDPDVATHSGNQSSAEPAPSTEPAPMQVDSSSQDT